MAGHSPSASLAAAPHGAKRARPSSPSSSPDRDRSPAPTAPDDQAGSGANKGGVQSSSFRNVSACNRCRLRKNRCDQRLPSCASCEKAGVSCVGYDPLMKKEIPRRSVTSLLRSYCVTAFRPRSPA